MERKNYEDCEIEVILFDAEDVIVTSEATPTLRHLLTDNQIA